MTHKYPSAEEIEQIVARRKQLAQELVSALLLTDERKRSSRLKQLEARYGQAEVERELTSFHRRANLLTDPDDENAVFYGQYVEFYRRFGGDRPFLTIEEYIEANDEAAPLIIKREMNQPMSQEEQEQLAYLSDLLLKEAIFWDDLMPDNPPAVMPQVELPPLTITAPGLAAGHPLSSYPLCPNDGFPLVAIEGELVCSVEALDHCLGGRTVVDVIKRGSTTYYVFEDGHELPLLCGCCGQALQVTDLAGVRKEIQGRRLIEMTIETRIIAEDGREYDQLVLGFSKQGMFSKPLQQPVAFEVAAQLRHPSPPPRTRPGSTSKKKTHSRKKTTSQKKTQSGKKKRRKKKR